MLWSRTRPVKQPVPRKSRPASFRPLVELLETRLAPAGGLASAPAVFQAAGGVGQWTFDPPFNQANQAQPTTIYGLGTDIPVIGDWTGRGRQDIGIFRNGLWVLNTTGTGSYSARDTSFVFGAPGDIPVVGDWNGSGVTNVGVVRQVNGALEWILDTNGTHQYAPNDATFVFGAAGDVPVVGKWAAPGSTFFDKADVGVFRQGTWVLDQNQAFQYQAGVDPVFIYGPANATPVTGEWVSRGQTNVGVVYASGSTDQWVFNTTGSRAYTPADTAFTFGQPTGAPLAGGIQSAGEFQANTSMVTALNVGPLAQTLDRSGLALQAGVAWFQFTTQGTGTTNDFVRLGFDSTQGQLQMTVYDAQGNVIGGTGAQPPTELRVKLQDVPAGTYFIAVTGPTGVEYNLHIDAPAPPGPAVPITNTSKATAQDLGTLPDPAPVAGAAAALLPAGVDAWYKFGLPKAGTANQQAVLQAAPVSHNWLNLELYDAAGTPLQTSSGPSQAQGVSLAGRPAGTYFLRVFADGGRATVPYTLSVQLPAPPPAPPPPTPPAAFFSNTTNFPDQDLANVIKSDMARDGQLTRQDWIDPTRGIFTFVANEGATISQAALTSLQTVLALSSDGTPANSGILDAPGGATGAGNPLQMDNYVFNLASKVVNPDPSNQFYQGNIPLCPNIGTTSNPLYGLQAGSPFTLLGSLVNKWFRGTDYPLAPRNGNTGNTAADLGSSSYPYQEATGDPLFGTDSNGNVRPRYEDIVQGEYLGDCFYLSSLGTIVSRQDLLPANFGGTLPAGLTAGPKYIGLYDPNTGTNPAGMFIDNGDRTWTIRYNYQNAAGNWVPDYVTVNDFFPTAGVGANGQQGGTFWFFANAQVQTFPESINPNTGQPTPVPLWVALAEKAYVQENASEHWSTGNFNNYWEIGGEYNGNQALMQISGQGGYQNIDTLSGLQAVTFTEIVNAYNGGVGAVFGTSNNPASDTASHPSSRIPIADSHDYMMIGYFIDPTDSSNDYILLRNPWGDLYSQGQQPESSGTYNSVANPGTAPSTFTTTALEVQATLPFLLYGTKIDNVNYNAFYIANQS